MHSRAATIFDQMTALSDVTRSRLLLVLERNELTVGELCAVLQLPQSTVSRHLKVLGDEGWVASRAEGTSRVYRIGERVDASARVTSVLAQRRSKSQEFFATAAEKWDRVRVELFGERAELLALLGLLD